MKVPRGGLTKKNRDRLAQFDEDPNLIKRVFDIISNSYKGADALLKDNKPMRAARLHQSAIALHILFIKPMRRSNLAALHMTRDLVVDSHGNHVGLRIPAEEVKNGVELHAAFPPGLTARLKRHVMVYRPLLLSAPNDYLFPGQHGNHLSSARVAHHITTMVSRGLGIQFHPHLVRHLAATLILDENPNGAAIAQRLLGHLDVKTTTQFYGQQRTRGAQKVWNDLLDRKMRAHRSGKGKSGPTGREKR